MKILVLTRYASNGASSRLRFLQYFPYLKINSIVLDNVPLFDEVYLNRFYDQEKRSWSVVIGSYFRRLKALLLTNRYDCVWIQGELFPWIPALPERLLSILNVPYIVDYDDAIFHNYDESPSILIRALLSKKIRVVMRNASIVVAGNPYIAEYAKKAGARNIEIIPTVVDTRRYEVRKCLEEKERFNIGWIGSLSTKKYLERMKQPLQALAQNVEIQLTTVGITHFEIGDVIIKEVEWRESTEAENIMAFDVGIMPLPDKSWAKGKCGYKLIQYMACGVPVLASPVGVNKQIVEHGVNGFLASTDEDWIKYLKILMNDKELRIAMGAQGRKKIEESYSLQVMQPNILALFSSALQLTRSKN